MTQGAGGGGNVGVGKIWTARSRLYRGRFLQPNTHFAAFFEIYKIYKPLHRSKLKILAIFFKIATFRQFF